MSNKHLQIVEDVVGEQIEILKKWKVSLNGEIDQAVEMILSCEGRVIISGVGKSGLIGQKIVATFASTGTPSFYLHPTEAFHGDLGMLKPVDVVILISYSGETDEVNKLIPSLKSFGNQIIAITGKEDSTLAKHADVFLNIGVEREICPNNLAPTSSTLVTLALGDALAVALMKARDFKPEDFAKFHPGGSLGRKLLCKVGDCMNAENLPFVSTDATLADCLLAMTASKSGVALVGDPKKLQGIITDGDIRRALVANQLNTEIKAQNIMTKAPHQVLDSEYLVKAEAQLKENKIHTLVVKNSQGHVVGLFEQSV
ncbi:KpsF/GutQ family sugar-phosphate isomerase [Wohlfahrtiimonas chitiniclastica]|uniref:KpsF/GutQ family sugar-phosphate isomerase n=1 Tax=Wohlfahrtiimonas chitiniclastica TaxID=400946 RepID=UPI001BD12212|nr:KpsF/GutQ family sugar-phosphate isomerase [Wohlfahrtiimonas chitiniclastica]MBS7817320.1 KpsF/GutQ family sugar-phosphate isomerase [Wohlfahrtiimonas chitiniclastica]MBS7823106.1 KpsF/GutQ family sugar-phosphate isomerase [Wohlfahrtiimonas chitiniclastica]MBS7830920.1 KpsF/GutQ family sugar-phosphate isomerase [Wohlfahrtiimonas chitiniclastica]MBS7832888.1 KpsF/GutQ family sugar-phosphate isomerase [Wohlfahrtiimonas chitiniclastica]